VACGVFIGVEVKSQHLLFPIRHPQSIRSQGMTENVRLIAITLPKEMIARIERERGDVSRSRYIMRLIEKGFKK
jgi:hypothetical protein